METPIYCHSRFAVFTSTHTSLIPLTSIASIDIYFESLVLKPFALLLLTFWLHYKTKVAKVNLILGDIEYYKQCGGSK